MLRWLAALLAAFSFTAPSSQGAALKVLTIGDSLSEEYLFMVAAGFSVNSKNWVELLSSRRAAEVTFGTYKSLYFSYGDLRNAGYRLNYGVPGNTTVDWIRIINTTGAIGTDAKTRSNLTTDLTRNCDVAVIFLGGNDLKDIYDQIFTDTEPAGYLDAIVNNIGRLHDWVRSKKASLPIVIATVPDIGATPTIRGTYNTPARQASTRQKIAAMNAAIRTLAATKGATVASVDQLTNQVYDIVPFHLNGTLLNTTTTSSSNASNYVFCNDGFHPSTPGQALITNQILSALSTATGRTLTPFSNREILSSILSLNPDAPYLSWKNNYPTLGSETADDDRDGIPNLVEFTLGTPPISASAPFQFLPNPGNQLQFIPSSTGLRYASLSIFESTNLQSWQPLPSNRLEISPSGTWTILPSSAGKSFYRFTATTRP